MKFSLPRLDQLKPRERLLATCFGAVLLLVALDRLVISPWLRHARTIREEIAHMEQAMQSQQRLLVRKERVTTELERYQRYLRPPVEDDLQMALLLKEVEELAKQSQLLLSEIKPLAVQTTDLVKQYSLDVRFQCTMTEWVAFLFEIESSPSLFQVVKANLATQADAPDKLAGSLRLIASAVREDTVDQATGQEARHATP